MAIAALGAALPWHSILAVLGNPAVRNGIQRSASQLATYAAAWPQYLDAGPGDVQLIGISYTTIWIVAIVVLFCMGLCFVAGCAGAAAAWWLLPKGRRLFQLHHAVPPVQQPGNELALRADTGRGRWATEQRAFSTSSASWDDLAKFLGTGGTAALTDAADSLDTTVDAVQLWYVAYQRANSGPTRRRSTTADRPDFLRSP